MVWCIFITIMATLSVLSPEFFEIVRESWDESPKRIKAHIFALKNWIKKSPHLKARCNDRLLLAFLRRTQFNLVETKFRIDAYYSFRNFFPEVLRGRGGGGVVSDLMKANQMAFHIIPQQPISATGPRLIISRFSKYDPKEFSPRHIFKLFFMMLEILAIEDDNTTISGISYVVDVRDVTLDQMMQYDSFLLKKMLMLIDYGLPVKFNEIHIINMRREAEADYDFLTSSFLPSKLPFKLIVHRQAEDLYKYIPRDAMTIEYGGHNSFACAAVKVWSQKLWDYKDYFAEDDHFGTNEKLRVGLTNNGNVKMDLDDGGMSGSFRKIQID